MGHYWQRGKGRKYKEKKKIKVVNIYCKSVSVYEDPGGYRVLIKNGKTERTVRRQAKKKHESCFHHIRPKSRYGSDEDWNLFPWFIGPHSAFHDLFNDSILREIWNEKLPNIYNEVFVISKYASGKNKDLETRFSEVSKRRIRFWQSAFGDLTLEAAQKMLKKMMWWNVFIDIDVKALNTSDFTEILESIKKDSDRLWSFHILFGNVDDMPVADLLFLIKNYTF